MKVIDWILRRDRLKLKWSPRCEALEALIFKQARAVMLWDKPRSMRERKLQDGLRQIHQQAAAVLFEARARANGVMPENEAKHAAK